MFATAFARRGFALPIWVNVVASGGTNGAAALVLANFAGVAAGTVAVAGAANLSLDGFAGVAAGAVRVSGGAAVTLAGLIGVAAGAVTPLAVAFTPAAARTLHGGNSRAGDAGFDRLLHGGFDRGLGES